MVSAHPGKLFFLVYHKVLFTTPFLIYINDLTYLHKIFADDMSIFSKVFDKDKAQRDLNDLN